jgi:hypothetical protein
MESGTFVPLYVPILEEMISFSVPYSLELFSIRLRVSLIELRRIRPSKEIKIPATMA